MSKQKTIKNEVSVSGIGLHTGANVNITLKPADTDEGISYIRTDLPGTPFIKAQPESIVKDSKMPRCTSIGAGKSVIHTVEHLMSALSGLGITNLTVKIDGEELPGLDGSGKDYVNIIKEAGIVEQDAESESFEIFEPIGVQSNGSSIYMVPSNKLQISYTLDYDHPWLKSQFFSTPVNSDIYENEIAPCRTFCLESEATELQSKGLGRGANYENTLVVGEEGIIKNKPRFKNEFARHKVLDFIGDLYLLGFPIKGQVFAVKSGHYLNLKLLDKIMEQRKKFLKRSVLNTLNIEGKKEIDTSEIMKILPHRYPFLLVDRVIEIERGKKAIGLKNVTINDHFFQGHFPTRPIMPGVLMIEAMAQTAGVTVLTNDAHRGKVAFFMAADNVKFRKTVTPGDQLIMEVEVLKDKARTAQIRAFARVGDVIVAEADMIFSFTDSQYLD